MAQPIVWFTHKEHKWKADLNRKPDWTDELRNWNWDNCTVSALRKSNDEVRLLIRSTDIIHSNLTEKDHLVRFLYNFDISEIPDPIQDNYDEPAKNLENNKKSGSPHSRWYLPLQRTDDTVKERKNCWIWQWSSEDGERKIHEICEMLRNVKNDPSLGSGIIESGTESLPTVTSNYTSEVSPIIYQPAIDTSKNFIRQIHIHKCEDKENEYEVTIVFNDEELRRHKNFDEIYRSLRSQLYGRTKDVETFRIILTDNDPTDFNFEGIYCEDKDISYDDVHGDKKRWPFGGVKKRPIKYYYVSKKHPKVFINTSNHAMGERDTNPRLWKWEYPTPKENSPIIVGNLSRKDVETELKDFRNKWERKTNQPID